MRAGTRRLSMRSCGSTTRLTAHSISRAISRRSRITADIAYVRLHGPGGKYQGSYSDEALGVWARRIRDWQRDLKAIIYFDNDDSGFAAFNALRLRELNESPNGSDRQKHHITH